jgi:hypothetical protein
VGSDRHSADDHPSCFFSVEKATRPRWHVLSTCRFRQLLNEPFESDVLRRLLKVEDALEAFRQAVLIGIYVQADWVGKREPSPLRSLHNIGNVISPRDVVGSNNARTKKEIAVCPIRAKNEKSNFVVVQVAIVESYHYPATAGFFLDRAVDKFQSFFKSYQRVITRQRRNSVRRIGRPSPRKCRDRRDRFRGPRSDGMSGPTMSLSPEGRRA